MDLDNITNMFYFQMFILKYDFDEMFNRLSESNNYFSFVENVNIMLDSYNDIFLIDIDSLRKVKLIIESLSFKYHSVNYIKNYQMDTYHKICVMERTILSLSEKDKNEVFEKIVKERVFPRSLELESDYIINLYKNDLNNYGMLLYQLEFFDDVDFLSFFSTVNRMCSLNENLFNDTKLRIGFRVMLMKFRKICNDSKLLQYAEFTENRVMEQVEKSESKVIFIKQYVKNRS